MAISATFWLNIRWLALLLPLSSTIPLAAQTPFIPRIAAGYSHSLSITSAGAVAAHGENRGGEIGDGTTTPRLSPVYLGSPDDRGWTQVAVGDFRSTAITTTGEMYSWGSNGYGQLGDGTLNDHRTPTRTAAPAGTIWAGVAAGYGHTLALTSTGELYTWGDNYYGQLGIGTAVRTLARQRIAPPAGKLWTQVAAGYNFSLALCSNGSLYTWGDNTNGQLGDGTTAARTSAVLVAPPTGQQWVQVTGGFWSAAALSSDGALYTWGNNYEGQLGDGTKVGQLSPMRLAPPAGQRWLQVAVGYEHMLAICSDGSLYSWGDNYYGQLGDGTNRSKLMPVRISPPAGKKWVQVAAGSYHSLALASDGQLYTTGYNYSGQLGDGTSVSQNCFVRTCNSALAATPATIARLEVSPNPFASEIRVKVNDNSGVVSLTLYSTLGQQIKAAVFTQLSPTKEVYLRDVASLPSGIYVLQVNTNQGKQLIKLVH
jgi:alpha-tubulin suppressor-like RCC1 family protein